MKSFDEVLVELKEIIKKDSRVFTLGQERVNVVSDFSDNVVWVQTDKSSEPQPVLVEWIREVWNILAEKGRICASDLDGLTQGRYRSSFIFTLLSKLPYINHIKIGRTNSIQLEDY